MLDQGDKFYLITLRVLINWLLHNVYILRIFTDNYFHKWPKRSKKKKKKKKKWLSQLQQHRVFIASLWPTLQYGQFILLTMWTVSIAWFLNKIFALDKNYNDLITYKIWILILNLIPNCTFENLVLKVFVLSCNSVIWIKIIFYLTLKTVLLYLLGDS